MNVLLRDFQEQAAGDFVRKLRRASRDAIEGELQAVSLSSPTGSGKTVMAISIIERILLGDYEEDPQSEAVFLWLTDLPELNIQTRDRMIAMSTVLGPQSLITIDNSFDAEELAAGKVYFLNTQKLGKSSTLIQRSDLREHGLWETISNTVRNKPGNFYLIVDEAHRGMNQTTQARNEATSIVQKFIFGSDGETPPVPLVLGISATPQRFNALLAGTGGTTMQRTHRPVAVDPADVRASGLIKEVVRFVRPNESQPSDMTLLREAVKSWMDYKRRWDSYCSTNKEDLVRPLLVVQVRDGSEGVITSTNLDEVISVIVEESGNGDERVFAHAFQDRGDIIANGINLRHIAPSEISQDLLAEVVFFKSSLNTGWDCPRAEVMMSFRSANDATHIAQLVGRMVRTPLTRRIEADERLNSVALFLPHYDAEGLKEVVSRLTAPDSESAIASDVVTVEALSCAKAPGSEQAFEMLSCLPSYSVPKSPQPNETRRLMKLARALARDEILKYAPELAAARIHEVIDEALEKERETVRFKELVEERDTLDIMIIDQLLGNSEIAEGSAEAIRTSPENIADLFESAGRKLGDGLHKEWWRRRVAANTKPYAAKLEFIALSGPELKRASDLAAKRMCREWMKRFAEQLRTLGESRNQAYEEIMGLASEPELSQLRFPETLDVPKLGTAWEKHIYQSETGSYFAELNEWEQEVVRSELSDPSVSYWLRSIPRKPWALAIPYLGDSGQFKTLYPDFIFVRKVGDGKYVTDIVDPHNPALGDSAAKLRGLADYAGLHGGSFGRIEAAIMAGESLIRIDLKNEDICAEALKVVTSADVEALFHARGTSRRGNA